MSLLAKHGVMLRTASSGITARAFRIHIPRRAPGPDGTTAAGYMNFRCGLAAAPGGSNVAANGSGALVAGATAAASSSFSGQFNGAAGWGSERDGTGDFWHSASQAPPWWISVDFGAGNTRTVRELYITPENTSPEARNPAELYLQASNNGTTWTNVLHVTGITGWQLGVEKHWGLAA